MPTSVLSNDTWTSIPGETVAKEGPANQQDQGLGPNNENLKQLYPRVVATLHDLIEQYRMEAIVARRHEIRRIRQARYFWQGIQKYRACLMRLISCLRATIASMRYCSIRSCRVATTRGYSCFRFSLFGPSPWSC